MDNASVDGERFKTQTQHLDQCSLNHPKLTLMHKRAEERHLMAGYKWIKVLDFWSAYPKD